MLVSITRLRLTSWFRIFKFFGLSTPAIDQAIQDPNCLAGATTHYKSKKIELPQRNEIARKLAQAPKFFRVQKPTAAHESKTIPDIAPKLMRRFK